MGGSATLLAGWYVSRKHAAVAVLVAACVAGLFVLKPFYDLGHFMFGTFRLREPLSFSFDGPKRFFEQFTMGNQLLFHRDGPTASVGVLESVAPHPAFGVDTNGQVVS